MASSGETQSFSPEYASAFREALFKEYDTLRQETLQAAGHRVQIIAFGTGAIGVLSAGALSLNENTAGFLHLVFGFAIPLLSMLLFIIWMGEFEKTTRVARHVRKIENRINRTFPGQQVLSWESSLTSQRIRYQYVAVAFLFSGMALTSPVLSFAAVEFQIQEVPNLLLDHLLSHFAFSVALVMGALLFSGQLYLAIRKQDRAPTPTA
jgi:hypothetical protein